MEQIKGAMDKAIDFTDTPIFVETTNAATEDQQRMREADCMLAEAVMA